MKLKNFLETHQKFTRRDSLPDNAGDGYLLEHNLVYQNVRKAALALGIKFTSQRFHDYDVLPLTQLPKILSSQTVPYLPNVRALEDVEAAMPEQFEVNELPPLRANYVLHETVHVIARLIRLKFLAEPSGSKASVKSLEVQREIALLILMEEAYANAAESLLSAFADTKIHDEFLARNAYIFERPATSKAMKTAIKAFGLDAVFKLVFFSFLFANFQREKATTAEFKRVMKVILPESGVRLNDRDVNLLRQIFQGGFDLDPMFTIRTNGFCLRLLGVTAHPRQLFAFDFLTKFEKEARYQNCLSTMAEVIAAGKVS